MAASGAAAAGPYTGWMQARCVDLCWAPGLARCRPDAGYLVGGFCVPRTSPLPLACAKLGSLSERNPSRDQNHSHKQEQMHLGDERHAVFRDERSRQSFQWQATGSGAMQLACLRQG